MEGIFSFWTSDFPSQESASTIHMKVITVDTPHIGYNPEHEKYKLIETCKIRNK